jgi:hypothetical protein
MYRYKGVDLPTSEEFVSWLLEPGQTELDEGDAEIVRWAEWYFFPRVLEETDKVVLVTIVFALPTLRYLDLLRSTTRHHGRFSRICVRATRELTDRTRNFVGKVLIFEKGYVPAHILNFNQAEAKAPKKTNNNCFFESGSQIKHDELLFRSKTEARLFDELKKRNVLVLPLPAAVLGGRGEKREPDFLICQDGNWGVLEVMGDQYHTPQNASKDHERARAFKEYGIYFIEFYDAARCYNHTKEVVDEFLTHLARSQR